MGLVAILNRVVGEDLSEKTTFKQRIKGNDGDSHANTGADWFRQRKQQVQRP